ncbi:MAG: hypothetical protein KF873_20390 [Gemmataceae bacterium]|nr:hypothetical protein [Gemmataceae bacterium]
MFKSLPGIGFIANEVPDAVPGDGPQVLAGCWTFPERNAQGTIIGLLRRYRNSQKKTMKGSRRGLYLPTGWQDRSGPLFVVEGPSDTLAMTAAELSVIGRPSNSGGASLTVELLAEIDGNFPVIVVGENDQKEYGLWPGRDGAESFARSLAKGLDQPILIAFPPDGAKDVRIWLTRKDRENIPWPERGRLLCELLMQSAVPVAPEAVTSTSSQVSEPITCGPTDAERALRYVARYNDRVRYVADWGCWSVYDGIRWVRDSQGILVQRLAFMLGEELRAKALEVVATGMRSLEQQRQATPPADPTAIATAEANLAEARESLGCTGAWLSVVKVQRMLTAARSHVDIYVECGAKKFDLHPYLLTVANGTIDLRSGELRPHNPADYLSALCPLQYLPDAKCPQYDRFLEGLFPDRPAVSEYLRDLSGYFITAETSDQTFVLLVGDGANGKTALLELWGHVLGEDFVYFAPPEILMDGGSDRHPTEKASLMGKRLVICSETEEEGLLNERRVKSLTGSDTVTARFCRQDFFSFRATHKLILATNCRPRIRGTDGGIWRRVRLVEFTRRFWSAADRLAKPDGEYPPEDEADANIAESLRGESAGILASMVREAVKYYAGGQKIQPPAEVMASVADYRRDEDIVGQFFDEKVRVTTAPSLSASDFYTAFRDWHRKQGCSDRYLTGPKKFGAAAKKRYRWSKSSVIRYAVRILTDYECECLPEREEGRIGTQIPVVLSAGPGHELSPAEPCSLILAKASTSAPPSVSMQAESEQKSKLMIDRDRPPQTE